MGFGGRLRALFCVETILITEYAVDDGDDVVSAARRAAVADVRHIKRRRRREPTNKAVNSRATVIRSTNIDINIDINMH